MKKYLWVLVLLGVLAAGCAEKVAAPDADFDLEPFQVMARSAGCADRVNRLFLIDQEGVFWHREGTCADAAYALTLYGRAVDEVICYLGDSIAGPQRTCAASAEALFTTITENLNARDLGLGKEHRVEAIPF